MTRPADDARAAAGPLPGLADTLRSLCMLAEQQAEGCVAVVMLLDDAGERLAVGAAPSLPPVFAQTMDGRPIADGGPCGEAVAQRAQVVLPDIAAEPRWAAFRTLALGLSLRALLTRPILSSDGSPLGSFALYFRSPGPPGARQVALLDPLSHLAAVAIERKRGDIALRASQERFALAVAGSNDGLWDWDILTNQMFISERAQRLYGLEPGPTVRPRAEWRAMVTVHPDDVERQIRLVDDYLAGGATYDGEWRVRHADGAYRWVRVRGACVRDAIGRATRLAGSVSDVDARRRAEAALLQAQRLEAAGTLAEGIAHDFNNILSAILGYGEMALRQVRPGTRTRRDIDSILVAAERGRSLVDRLLAFSRSHVADRLPVHVERVVRESIDMLSATLPQAVAMQVQLEAGRAAMLGDETLVHQVFMNLATNAVQAMPDGGRLSIGLALRAHEAEWVATTGVLAAGPYIVLKVADTGSGIAQDTLHRIFDPFFTTKEAGVGLGLGLSLVHGLVSSAGGAVEVASQPGEGSVFTVYLPHAGEAPPEPDAQDPDLPRGQGQRVLVVDDEPALVTLLTDALGDLGYEPVGHTSSLAARDALQADAAGFDALVTDERMPGVTGIELVRLARNLNPGLPIVLASGFLGGPIAAQARDAGADEVLQKPLSIQHLARVLAQLLAGPAQPH